MKAILVVAIALVATSAQGQVTFTKDVAPILQKRCQVCHRPDTFAPMSLLTYEDARPWARSIKQKVLAREMPPWYIDKNVGIHNFRNDVSLSDEEIATIVKWVDSGAPKGVMEDMPPPRKFENSDQWHIRPDLIVQLPKDQVVPAQAKALGELVQAFAFADDGLAAAGANHDSNSQKYASVKRRETFRFSAAATMASSCRAANRALPVSA